MQWVHEKRRKSLSSFGFLPKLEDFCSEGSTFSYHRMAELQEMASEPPTCPLPKQDLCCSWQRRLAWKKSLKDLTVLQSKLPQAPQPHHLGQFPILYSGPPALQIRHVFPCPSETPSRLFLSTFNHHPPSSLKHI